MVDNTMFARRFEERVYRRRRRAYGNAGIGPFERHRRPMSGETFPFVAGCIFFGLGALLILSLLQYLWQRTRWRGRATGTVVAIDTVAAAEDPRTIATAPHGLAA